MADRHCVEVSVAALFVQTNGHYFGLDGVDPWDIHRDARKYAGPYPVVAHPPCNLWVSFTFVNFKRYGGEHNRPGNDGGCFGFALASCTAMGRRTRASSLIPCLESIRSLRAQKDRLDCMRPERVGL